SVTSGDLDPILKERCVVTIGFDCGWLIACRPDRAGVDIAQEHVAAPAIAGRILVPACDRQIAPMAVSRTRRGHHHCVAAVGEKLRLDSSLMWRLEMSQGRRNEFAYIGCGLHFFSEADGVYVARRAFL